MNDLIITNKGQELISKMIAGTSTCTFTKIQTSDYDYSSVILTDLTSLYDVKQTSLVSSVVRTDTTMVEVLAAINNSDLANGYYVKAVGLFAKDSDGTEILYGVSIETENPDYMPAFGGKTVSGITYKINTKVDIANLVTLEIDPAAVPTMQQVQEINTALTVHGNSQIYGENGIHGFRYYNDELQVMNEDGEWVEIETGGGGVSPSNVTDAKVKVGNGKLTVFWSDPGNTVVDGQILCTWAGTKLVQKAGAYPENPKDGTVLVDNKVLDTYKTNGFEINGLTNGVTYYFALFPYADTGATNINEGNRLVGTPQPYRTMTAVIDLSNSNPATCISYADDATGMTAGSSDWDDFFGHYPVLLKNGVEVGKLNPNNFDQFEDGSTADISGGNAGDAMICFPRRGLKITTVGNTLTIKMTDDPDNADFEYNAHTRGSTYKEKFYLGVYKGYKDGSSKLRSLKGKTPTASQTIGTFRTQAHNNGAGYEQSGFYQLTFRQCMYILKYKNLNSQTVIGRGFVDGNSAVKTTGGTETKGMDWGETTGKDHMKLFGMEDFWGNIWEWIDGLVSNSAWEVLTGNDNFNDAGTGYTNNGNGGVSTDTGGYMSKPQGTTKAGFVMKEKSGSETTYFSDYASLYGGCVARFGGRWLNASSAGAFLLYVNDAASGSSADVAARLMYL